jgi:hypothetical protein
MCRPDLLFDSTWKEYQVEHKIPFQIEGMMGTQQNPHNGESSYLADMEGKGDPLGMPQPSILWQKVQSIGMDIDRWVFVSQFDDLQEIVWDVWRYRRSVGTINFLREEIGKGEAFIQRLMEVMPSGGEAKDDLMEWCSEMSELLSRVHRAIAVLQSKLDLVESGLQKTYPTILQP